MTNKTAVNRPEQNTFKPLIGLVLIFILFSIFNIPVLQTIWDNSFDDGTYSHAYLIPFITMYLYYQLSKTGQLTYRCGPSVLPILMLCFSAVLFFIMVSAQISLGYWSAMMAILLSSVLLIYRANWQVVFPTLFLIFLMPWWGLLTIILQKISVDSVTFLMSLSGIPTYVEGNLITIPAGVFEIADGCSGLRYLIVSLAISSLFNFLYIKNTRKALMFFTVAILGALITNWIRITALILIGEYTNMESDLMTDHNMFGWYLYIPFMFLLFMWGNKLADNDQLSTKVATNENTALKNNTYPALPNVLILFLVVATSSTALKALFTPNITTSTEITKNIEIQPIINNFTHIEQVTLQTGKYETRYLKYFFNGELDNGKPTAFGNSVIPFGWHEVSREAFGDWQYITIAQRNNKAIIRLSFEINEQKFASSGAFKKQRIMSALTGTSETYLHWQYIACLKSCEQEKASLQQAD
ncbi:exosortase [Colwellia sp. 6M3]|uniref:exosortase n=1 Tax=Colwellia sp. 6M3 TaxID=2759849 RepID=UPI0015F3695B|nr:exosortase [Colwellia sp. 6M3]MBA6417201.1 exosortase [Colwellia sp. 6M3]